MDGKKSDGVKRKRKKRKVQNRVSEGSIRMKRK